MKAKTFRLTDLMLVFALLFYGGGGVLARQAALPQGKRAAEQPALAQTFGGLPLLFIRNQGQMDSHVAYYLQGQDTSVYFASDGLTFALSAPVTDTQPSDLSDALLNAKNPKDLEKPAVKTGRWVLKLDFLGANPGVLPYGEEQAETVVSYFNGSPEQWHTGLPTYHRLVYPDLWPGIDLAYSGSGDRLKYEFIVRPGADPGQIRLAYRGLSALTLNRVGQLEISTPVRTVQDEAPTAYQLYGGKQIQVAANYEVDSPTSLENGPNLMDASADENIWFYSFQVPNYDPALPLVIDPAFLVYNGYIGGSGGDWGWDIVVDKSGSAYVAGTTESNQSTFPVNIGPDLTLNGDKDVFVAKVLPDGTGLAYAGYIGGSNMDIGNGIAVDDSGAAYITGLTTSNQATFPVIVGPDLTYNGGNLDAFVAKVRPDGTGLVYCGYIGGSGDDEGLGIAVDDSGAAYVAGDTTSDATTFPVSVGPDLTYNSNGDAFVAKINSDGSGLAYAGYIGGSNVDHGYGIAVDEGGAAYVTGWTFSNQATFPVLVGPDLTFNGIFDAFVAKVRPDGAGLIYAGYIGGNDGDDSERIAVDKSGAAYITGLTFSDEKSFPVLVGPDLTYNGNGDAYVAKVRPDGTGLVYAGYVGGSNPDHGFGIALDGSGAAYITGWTYSGSTGFSDFSDAFVAKIRSDGEGLVYNNKIGGIDDDFGIGIAVDGSRAAYITGYTSSDQSTFPVIGGPDLTYNSGGSDAFVAKISTGNQIFLPVIRR
jgi:hypothetical protein